MRLNLQALLGFYLVKLDGEVLSASTKRTYISRVRQFIEYLDLIALGQDEASSDWIVLAAEAYLLDSAMHRSANDASINSTATAIQHFLRTLNLYDGRLSRPVPELLPNCFLSDKQLDMLFQAAGQFSARDRAIVLLLGATGIRVGECEALDVEHIERTEFTNAVAVTRNNCRQRIPLTGEAADAVLAWLKVRTAYVFPGGGRALFVTKDGARMSRRAISDTVRRVGWAARLEVSPLVLRASRLMRVARNNNDITTVANVAGYTSLGSARRLLRLSR